MQALSVVIAAACSGRKLDSLLLGAGALSAAAGAPSVVVAYAHARSRLQPMDYGEVELVLHPSELGVGSALVSGARRAQAPRCLLLDALPVDEELVWAHRRVPAGAEVVSVGSVALTQQGDSETWVECDPLYAFALQGALNACVPRAILLELTGREPLDAVSAYRLARRLRARGISFVAASTAVGYETTRHPHGRALGRAAAVLYREDQATLPQSGLGGFKRGSLGQITLRRVLVAVPGAARAIQGLARSAPSPTPRARLRDVSSEALFWRGARSALDRETWRRLKSEVTILMYHAFADDAEPASWYVVPARKLARQLVVLRVLRRRVLPLAAYVSIREGYTLPAPRTVVITIDDGYEDAYDVAAPIFAAHGCSAIVFAVSGHIGQRAGWTPDGPLHDRRLAGWQRLREGLDAGLDVGAHTRTHPRLTELSDEAASEEVEGSRRELGEGLGRTVTSFAYPHGDEDARTRQLVSAAGFAAACTSRGGRNGPCEPLDSLRRVEIRGDQGLVRFVLAVMLGRRHLVTPRRGRQGLAE